MRVLRRRPEGEPVAVRVPARDGAALSIGMPAWRWIEKRSRTTSEASSSAAARRPSRRRSGRRCCRPSPRGRRGHRRRALARPSRPPATGRSRPRRAPPRPRRRNGSPRRRRPRPGRRRAACRRGAAGGTGGGAAGGPRRASPAACPRERRQRAWRDVRGGEHRDDAGQRERSACVEASDRGMRTGSGRRRCAPVGRFTSATYVAVESLLLSVL